MRFLLDTNVVSDLVRNPRGRITDHIARVGEGHVGTSIIVAAELRYGAAKRGSSRLSAQLEKILDVLAVVPFEAPADTFYGGLLSADPPTCASLLHLRRHATREPPPARPALNVGR